jgi:Zn-dependent protease/CBS domain-containing protein
MFANRWQLFRLRGIPISVDLSWLAILALLTLTIASSIPGWLQEFFGSRAVSLAPTQYWSLGLIAALLFFACILLHELGHAAVARSRGMPIRGITLFLFGGVAELEGEPPSAGTEFLMAIAGPFVSLVLGAAFGLMAWSGYVSGWPPPVVVILGYLSLVNVLLLAFNLIPAFPLDGGRVLHSLLWQTTGDVRRATRWASAAGQGFAWLLIAWGIVQFFGGNWLGGIWSGLIGLFLNNAAQGSYQQLLIRNALRGEPVKRFMNAQPVVVPQTLDLLHWVEDYVYRFHHRAFPVTSDGHLEGYISTRELAGMPRAEWYRRTIGEVMQRDLHSITIAPDTDAMEALEKMQQSGSSRLLVVDHDHLLGIISLTDLLRFLDLKMELTGDTRGNGRRSVPPLNGKRTTAQLVHNGHH